MHQTHHPWIEKQFTHWLCELFHFQSSFIANQPVFLTEINFGTLHSVHLSNSVKTNFFFPHLTLSFRISKPSFIYTQRIISACAVHWMWSSSFCAINNVNGNRKSYAWQRIIGTHVSEHQCYNYFQVSSFNRLEFFFFPVAIFDSLCELIRLRNIFIRSVDYSARLRLLGFYILLWLKLHITHCLLILIANIHGVKLLFGVFFGIEWTKCDVNSVSYIALFLYIIIS